MKNELNELIIQIGGMKEGDYLVGIGDQDVKWSTHADVVNTIKGAGNSLKLRLVTPLNKAKTSFSKPKVRTSVFALFNKKLTIKLKNWSLCLNLEFSNPFIFANWWYFKLGLFDLAEKIVWNISWPTILSEKYRDLNIIVCGNNSISLEKKWTFKVF